MKKGSFTLTTSRRRSDEGDDDDEEEEEEEDEEEQKRKEEKDDFPGDDTRVRSFCVNYCGVSRREEMRLRRREAVGVARAVAVDSGCR